MIMALLLLNLCLALTFVEGLVPFPSPSSRQVVGTKQLSKRENTVVWETDTECDFSPDTSDLYLGDEPLPTSTSALTAIGDANIRTIFSTHTSIAYDVNKTVSVETVEFPKQTAFQLPALSGVEPQITGLLNSDLGEPGQPTQNRLLTEPIRTLLSLPTFTSQQPKESTSQSSFKYSISSVTPSTITPTTSDESETKESTRYTRKNSCKPTETNMPVQDIFAEPIDTKPPPSRFPSRHDHPVPRTGIQSEGPLQTNKFYSNLFLGNQQGPVYTFPYSVTWVAGTGVTKSQGMACSHIDAAQREFGRARFDVEASYYLNPIGISSMVLSAMELGDETTLTTDSISAFSIRAHLSASKTSEPLISFPLVQGMAYITAEYNGATPLIQSGVYFRNVTRFTEKPKSHVTKYKFILEDGTTWRLYGYRTKGEELDLSVLNNGVASSSKPFHGIIQVVKESATTDKAKAVDNALDTLDSGAGVYPVSMEIRGNVSGSTGQYEFEYERAGHATGELLMFALPHHVDSFDPETSSRQVNDVSLLTTTKGVAIMVKGSKWKMVEPSMPTELGFAPFQPGKGSLEKLSDNAKMAIHAAASKEMRQDMMAATDLDSMYWSGKALGKYAHMLYVVNDMLGDTRLAQTGLGQLKAAFGRFTNNSQKIPLVYDTAWGGVTSSGSYGGKDLLADFGNTLYNDHHFHFGYHILAAAIIGYLDKSWIGENKEYVNMLVRDTSNPSARDRFFPMWRSFDWYHGHSWATGLFPSLDGKNQESSSEDMMHAYALKMWGKVSGDEAMEARATLQLAIMARSFKQYYLYKSSNTVQPKQFIGNKVAGILFENKVDHATFFSADIEAIQGIHMIPILPVTTVARDAEFVQEEWEAFFSRGRVDDIDNSWKSILLGNLATISPQEAFAALNSSKFEERWLDGGISLTWLMAYSAALGGL